MKKTIRVLGIDPGLTNTGYNITAYDPVERKSIVVARGIINATTIAKKRRQEYKDFGNIISLFVYEKEIQELMDEYKPDYVACEDAFYNPRTPNAFLSLKLCITSIRRVLYSLYNKQLYLISPCSAKLAVYGKGGANKEAVQESILHLDNLHIKNTKQNPINKMVEHEADSIAISYAFISFVLPDILMQDNNTKK